MSQINVAISHFDEACCYHRAAHALRFRAAAGSNLPPEQAAQRRAIMELAARLLDDEIDKCVKLGIVTWNAAQNPNRAPDLAVDI